MTDLHQAQLLHAARSSGFNFNPTLGDLEELLRMVRDRDLIHIDEAEDELRKLCRIVIDPADIPEMRAMIQQHAHACGLVAYEAQE